MNNLERGPKFQVAHGFENAIKNKGGKEGYIYFATDTKKIFYGKELLPMGGNSGIFYGNQPIPEIPDFTELIFERQYIEGENTPNVDDLILNNDGCFYRVTDILEENGQEIFKTKKQTLQGTGGGGGTGGGPSTPVGEGSVTLIEPTASTSILYGEDFTVKFNIRAVDADGIETLDPITYSVYLNNSCIIKNAPGKQGENETENLKKYLNLGDKNTIVIYAYAYIGGTEPVSLKTKAINVTTVTMNLIWDYDEKQLNYIEDDFNLKWILTGANGIEKNTHIIINDLYNIDLTNAEENKNSTTERNYRLKWSDYGLNYHAVHKVEIYGDIVLNGVTIPTSHIVKNILLIDRKNDSPLISCNLPSKEVMQYNTIQIPIMIYSSANIVGDFTINLNEDGKLRDSWPNIKNLEWNNWNYTPTKAGDININIQCGESEVSFLLKVTPLNINNEEVSDYAFKFAASQLTSNNAVRAWKSNDVTATFTDSDGNVNGFDWINGGLKSEKDENGFNRQYVYIPAGSKMTINYELFKKAANVYGKTFKIIFKATKCRNYDAQILKCWSSNSETSLVLQAQTATFKTGSISMDIPYCEDKYLEFEIDVTKKDTGKRYITTWLDGVPCGIRSYTEDDQFTQSNPEYIEIGSEECDVCLYLFKVYEKHLTDEQHLENFIADAPNAEEMLARFKRNDILDESGEISYLKLAEANPNCKVHIYDIRRMTVTKNDKIDKCSYSQYHGSSSAVLSSDNCTIRVQGTSSAAYGLAAFNLDTDFTAKEIIDGEEKKVCTLYDAEGNRLVDGWSMTKDALPCTYFTTKVNVASCEGANNAINQEWYNKFQPYKSPAKEKNSKARDTMQFTPGVIFIRDNNKLTNDPNGAGENENVFKDTPGYVDAPFYKMYSVCNMGNSKKNVHVFHDLTNPLECCIENGDNQLPGQWMIIPQGGHFEGKLFVAENLENIDTEENYNKWIAGMDEIYSFRYPDAKPTELLEEDHENAEKMIRGWFNFVNWMSMNDPNPRYEKIDILNEEAFNKNEKLFIIDNERHVPATEYIEGIEYFIETPHLRGYTNEPLAEPVTFDNYTFKNTKYTKTLAGLTVYDYAGKYTHDTYKYRMAKMLSECEEHLVMDSIVFHYLFIERHTMIDNVAKNTFWSTEDCVHWDLTKDYDNDTADGNDNQGKLSLTYGYEPLDKKDGINVFNASDSVWLTFIQGLPSVRQEMYQALDNQGAWSAKNYLKDFNDWQNAIPERCWIEDYYRKYVRPLEIYNNSAFLAMLEGGKKTHQREQYETYQNYYISSEYLGKDASAAKIIMRPNAKGLEGDRIPVKMYADCYIQASIGNGTEKPNTKRRVKRGTEEYLEIPKGFDNVTDATTYLFSPYLFSELGNEEYTLQNLLLKQFSTANARKLTKVALGVYGQDDLSPIVALDQDLVFSGSDLLEELHIANYHLDGRALDLTENKSLKFLDARNSHFTAIALADGCAIEKVYLENPTILSLSNLTKVEDFDINDYSRLNSLNLINVDKSPNLNSYDLVIKTLEKDKNNLNSNDNIFKTYYLKDVDWKINNFNEITNNGSYLSIYALEELQKRRSSKEGYGHETSLIGILSIGKQAFIGDAEISLKTYKYYRKIYPSLDINFESENSKLYTVNILDGNNKVCWTSKLKSGDSVDEKFLGAEDADGNGGGLNNGVIKAYDISYTNKESSAAESYTFANSWKVYDAITGEELNYQVNATEENGYMPWINNVSRDINIVPQYVSETREYIVTFYNITPENSKIEVKIPYGTILETMIPKDVPYKDDSGLNLYETYHFDGFAASENGSILKDLNKFEIKTTLNLYAQFSKIDVHQNVFDNKYFDFDFDNVNKGYIISAKKEYPLAGKVTLPIKYNNSDIIEIANFSSTNNQGGITHIFWENQNECKVALIRDKAFEGEINKDFDKLKYFEMPENTKITIGASAFIGCSYLFEGMDSHQIENWFKNVISIKTRAFQSSSKALKKVILSDCLENLEFQAFAYTSLKEVQIGYPDKYSVLKADKIGDAIFNSSLKDEGSRVDFYTNDVGAKNKLGEQLPANVSYNDWEGEQ